MQTRENSSDQITDINEALDRFVTRFQEADEALRTSRHGLWRAVGSIVELAPRIESELFAGNRLRSRVKDIDAVKNSRNFNPMKLDIEQLLIILAMGYDEDRKAKRSQYYAAIEMFKKDDGNERTEAAFFEFVKSKGGLRKAGRSSSNSDGSDDGANQSASSGKGEANKGESIAKKRLIPNAVSLWKRSRDLPVFSSDLPDDAFVQGSASLAIVIRGPDINGTPQLAIAEIVSDEKLVEREVARAARALSVSYREAVLIYRINEFALILGQAPFIVGRIRSRAAIGFLRAVRRLKDRPEWCEKYGLAEAKLPSIEYCNDGHEDTGSAAVANPTFHEWDPGRFIKGAKAGVLVPYSLKGSSSQISDAAKAYASDFTSWKARWAKLETVSPTPYRSSSPGVLGGSERNANNAIGYDAPNVGQSQADDPKVTPAGLEPIEAAEEGTGPSDKDDSEPTADPSEKRAEEDGPAARDISEGIMQPFDMSQREPEMAD